MVTEVARLEGTTDERGASLELLWRRMEDSSSSSTDTAFTFSNSSSRSTSAAFRPSHCREEDDSYL